MLVTLLLTSLRKGEATSPSLTSHIAEEYLIRSQEDSQIQGVCHPSFLALLATDEDPTYYDIRATYEQSEKRVRQTSRASATEKVDR